MATDRFRHRASGVIALVGGRMWSNTGKSEVSLHLVSDPRGLDPETLPPFHVYPATETGRAYADPLVISGEQFRDEWEPEEG